MKTINPKIVTVLGLLLALSAVFVDPANSQWLAALIGANAAAKLAAAGAIIAALGRALFAPSDSNTPTP